MTVKMTITEGLAELKTLNKRLASKRQSIMLYLTRLEGLKDPLSNGLGSAEFIRREEQAIADMENRLIAIRRSILLANISTTVTINGTERSILEWLMWRREVADGQKIHMVQKRGHLITARQNAQRNGANVVASADKAQKPNDVIVNIDEAKLADDLENFENTLGNLDGVLSLKNATVMMEV